MSIGEEDIVGVGGELDPGSLLEAYRTGVFPYPVDEPPVIVWLCPRERAILDFRLLHIPRSLARAHRQSSLRHTINAAFDQVIDACASVPRPDQEGTWITDEMKAAYRALHRLGYAHSFESWRGDELVGGLYGVETHGVFSAESMFHLVPNASKLALLHLVDHLTARGIDWIDIHVMSPHMEALGATVLSRAAFLARVDRTHDRDLHLFDGALSPTT